MQNSVRRNYGDLGIIVVFIGVCCPASGTMYKFTLNLI